MYIYSFAAQRQFLCQIYLLRYVHGKFFNTMRNWLCLNPLHKLLDIPHWGTHPYLYITYIHACTRVMYVFYVHVRLLRRRS
jgi:hypothetical protein